MRQQTTAHILMIRPARFAFNEETAASNAFQQQRAGLTGEQIRKKAIAEFDAFVAKLQEAGVDVLVVQDTPKPPKPDAVFPNNWVTFHQEGILVTYPMQAPSRRRERRPRVVQAAIQQGFQPNKRLNLAGYEAKERFLEGTGSIIFDHLHRLAYACLSPRTDPEILREVCRQIAYEPVVFHAADGNGREIYHTNVMMAMGETFVVICLDAVRDRAERDDLLRRFAQTEKEVVPISLDQMNRFAGNMLQVHNREGQTILVMSECAFRALTEEQVASLSKHTRLLYSDLETIETYGGGSARCMMAEMFMGS
jgi:hypothetical protein